MTIKYGTIKHGFMVMVLVGGLALDVQATETSRTVDADMSSQEIYFDVEALLALKDQAATGFWSDKKNQLAGAAGTVLTPVWFYLGYAAIEHFQTQQGSIDAIRRIAALRNALADKLCFVQ